MRLIALYDDAVVADVVCGREAIYIGTKDTCSLRLPDPRVGAQPLVVYPDASGAWMIEALDSADGVRLNGSLLDGKAALGNGDEIELLPYLLRAFPDFEEQTAERKHMLTTRESLERFTATQVPAGTISRKADEPVTVSRAALQRAGKIGAETSQCTTPTEFIDVALQAMQTCFAAHRVWIGLRRVNYGPMEYVEGRYLHGGAADLPPIGESLQTRTLDRSVYLLVPRISRQERVSILAGPLLGPEGPLGMVYLDSGEGGRRFENADLDDFIHLTSVLAAHLHVIFHDMARNRAALIEGSVSVAHEIQNRLTPRKLPQWDALQFGAFREPGREKSGDIYDVVRLVNNLAAMFVAHTERIGPLPSLLMAQTHAAFRCACMHQDSPQVFMQGLNWLVYDAADPPLLNCFMGAIDPASGVMRYALAGGIGAYIIGARGEDRRLGGEIPSGPLGVEKSTQFPLYSEELAPGESLVVFTSGVTTARNRNEEVFGRERFVNILCDGFSQLASAMLKEMMSDLRNFTQGGKQPDDITVLLAHRVAD